MRLQRWNARPHQSNSLIFCLKERNDRGRKELTGVSIPNNTRNGQTQDPSSAAFDAGWSCSGRDTQEANDSSISHPLAWKLVSSARPDPLGNSREYVVPACNPSAGGQTPEAHSSPLEESGSLLQFLYQRKQAAHHTAVPRGCRRTPSVLSSSTPLRTTSAGDLQGKDRRPPHH